MTPCIDDTSYKKKLLITTTSYINSSSSDYYYYYSLAHPHKALKTKFCYNKNSKNASR